ncbi:MAG: aminoacetone oxidase family FAD-binding enzyme [Prevotellaceae bacterium]|nr:aminoacetone oxidase family FAD-binding enzyme [Candidatus Minthosoma caballi]
MGLSVVGGGAAGFFLAINVKKMLPELDVTIFEQQKKVLSKVEISGGGRCNCTNTFAEITDLKQAYPRGASLLKRLFKQFGPKEAYNWFEDHGVPLVVQDDECVFPQAQDSHAIINCFLNEAKQLGVKIKLGTKISNAESLLKANGGNSDYVAVTVGGTPSKEGCVPSLFTFNINDSALKKLMGTVVENAIASIPGTKMRAQGPLLITHWGMSGPAILKLSSYAARHLAEQSYKSPLLINWTGESNSEEVRSHIIYLLEQNPQKQIDNVRPFNLPARLWDYLLDKASLKGKRCSEIGKKGTNRLTELLTNDTHQIASRCHYKDEFVTCGGVSLDSIDKSTLESKFTPNLFYAGEVLDIDGITGGFNFQAAWTTAYAVAKGIEGKVKNR